MAAALRLPAVSDTSFHRISACIFDLGMTFTEYIVHESYEARLYITIVCEVGERRREQWDSESEGVRRLYLDLWVASM